MLFNSWIFVLLVVVTTGLYYACRSQRAQICVLIAASLIFYGYDQPYLLALLLASALINSVCSYFVVVGTEPGRRRAWAAAGIVANLALLIFFKYNRLIAESLFANAPADGSVGHFLLTLPLPIGISFFTFQGISLMLDVLHDGEAALGGPGRERRTFTGHAIKTLFFKAFFPQLVAGPIVKAREFYPQIGHKRLGDVQWRSVVTLLITGYFLKMVVADNLKDQTFWISYPYFEQRSSLELIAMLFAFSMQIFADFAGYSLIAIGIALIFGYTLPPNFNFPYVAQSFSDFWRRWHISLSSWLRDYLYKPLGGSRRGEIRTYLNLMIVMFLGGLWHGAAWSYAVWGTWHGVALALERPFLHTAFFRSKAVTVSGMRMAMVFAFVSASWLLFKLPDIHHVGGYLVSLANNWSIPSNKLNLAVMAMLSLPVIGYHAWHLLAEHRPAMLERLRPALLGVMFAAVVLNSGSADAFIYFQF